MSAIIIIDQMKKVLLRSKNFKPQNRTVKKMDQTKYGYAEDSYLARVLYERQILNKSQV